MAWIGEVNNFVCRSGTVQEEHPLQISGMSFSARKSVALNWRPGSTFRLDATRSDGLACPAAMDWMCCSGGVRSIPAAWLVLDAMANKAKAARKRRMVCPPCQRLPFQARSLVRQCLIGPESQRPIRPKVRSMVSPQ
jgi:hypothetical protein